MASGAHLATLHPSQARGAAPRVGRLHLRRGRVFPVPPKRQPALRRVARERARCVRVLDLSSRPQVPAEASGTHRGGLRNDSVSELTGRMSLQLSRACETVAEAKLTASGRSLSPEHPRVPGQRKTLGNRHIQLSLPFG